MVISKGTPFDLPSLVSAAGFIRSVTRSIATMENSEGE